MTINIIIPVLNEESVIMEKIRTVVNYLDKTKLKDLYKLTIIDNGSSDHTGLIAQKLVKQFYGVVYYIRLEQKGVGLAFRTGILKNDCDVVGYMDLDLATDLKHLLQIYEAFTNKCEVAVGSRLLPNSKVIGRSLVRNITSISLNILLKMYLRVNFSDAMCGFKFYNADTSRRLVEECSETNGWFYCAEMMIRAEWLGIHIMEIPVIWTDDPDSKVKIGKLSMEYLSEIQKLHMERRRYMK